MKNTNRKKTTLIFSSIFITLLFLNVTSFFPNGATSKVYSTNDNILFPQTSQITPTNIRVAIYNEPNVTQPAYSSHSTLTNDYSA